MSLTRRPRSDQRSELQRAQDRAALKVLLIGGAVAACIMLLFFVVLPMMLGPVKL